MERVSFKKVTLALMGKNFVPDLKLAGRFKYKHPQAAIRRYMGNLRKAQLSDRPKVFFNLSSLPEEYRPTPFEMQEYIRLWSIKNHLTYCTAMYGSTFKVIIQSQQQEKL